MSSGGRKSYTAEFELKAVDYAAENGTGQASQKFGVDRRMIQRWRRPPPKWPALEEELSDWIIEQRERGRRVTTVRLRAKAIEAAQRLGYEDFTGGAHWCHSFMKRKGFSVRQRTSVGQPLPPDAEAKMANFRKFVMDNTMNVNPANLGNFDEVPVPYDVAGNRTVEITGKDDVAITTTGHEKKNLTVVLAVTADGNKLKPMLIFKRLTMPKVRFPEGVVIKVNQKGWMTEAIMKDWIRECWLTRPNAAQEPSRSMLIFDSARSHLSDEVKTEIESVSKIAVIPGGLTKFLQPLDVAVNKPFKDNLRKHWDAWMADSNQMELTRGGRRKPPRLELIAEWVLQSFRDVSVDSILNGSNEALTIDPDIDDLDNSFSSMHLDDSESA
ncbi:unnamed protein product [Cylicocyclus nassatus]|uniref:HTH CENPB-type domain-containing protein n=1 Tax=Cylicocyclus nassatus TaxID=53992 RepID=A0AA36DMV6_CYLNA|nr:unnamed protein product [Cylicocyclus nassatus]